MQCAQKVNSWASVICSEYHFTLHYCWIRKLSGDISEWCFLRDILPIQHSALIASVSVCCGLADHGRRWLIKTMQTVYQGSRHVESPIRNALKWTPFYSSRPESGYLWSQKSKTLSACVCVCVCLVFSITPLPCVDSLHCNVHKLLSERPRENSEVKQYQHEVIASLHLSAMPPKLFQYCEQLSLLLLRPNLHFLHAYYMLKRHTCMPQRYNSPWCLHPAGHNPFLCPSGP